MAQFITPQEAAALVNDNDSLVVEGFLLNAVPEQLIGALEKRFLDSGYPRDITVLYSSSIGNGKGAGINRLGHEGLLKRVIGAHWNLAPTLGKMALENKIEAYNLPQGTLVHMFRDVAGGKVGTITHVGLKTFVDPRQQGGKVNPRTTEDLVEVINVAGTEQLFFKKLPMDICFIRASYADELGNITMEKEGITLEVTSVAQALHNTGGKVVVQVGKKVKAGTLDPKLVKIPGIYVDYIVVVPEEEHMWEVTRERADAHCGAARMPMDALPPLSLNERKIIARRAAMELAPGAAVNLGIGVPEAIALVAAEEGISDFMTLTVESGPIGGIPAAVPIFGVSINPLCIMDQPAQFDFYDGGGLDMAFLGLAECDESGNLNVSRMGSRLAGCGGFINITQNSKRVFFCGTFTGKGLKTSISDGKLVIDQEGSLKKFLKEVQQITFSGEYAVERGTPVLYITERAVFELHADGLHLVEIAPGIDVERDILPNMDFMPIINGTPKLMDERIFRDEPMGLSGKKNISASPSRLPEAPQHAVGSAM